MKSITRPLLLLFLVFLQTQVNTISAQEPKNSRFEKIQSMKIGFITERLNLTPEEAEVFWPIYNDFQNRRDKINRDRNKTNHFFIDHVDNMSDKEIEATLDDYIKYHKQETDLLIEYHEKFKKALPPKKVMKLYISELQFRGFLLEQLRDRPRRGRR